MFRIVRALAPALLLTWSTQALAWGQAGHAVTALIAERYLTPAAKAKLDALLASDTDPLTAPDFASRAAWADRYRNDHRETALWHYIDVEIDAPGGTAAAGTAAASGAGIVIGRRWPSRRSASAARANSAALWPRSRPSAMDSVQSAR